MRVASFTSLSHATTIGVTELLPQGGIFATLRCADRVMGWVGWGYRYGLARFFPKGFFELARCLIETASSRHGETAAGCGSIAALGSYPTKEDRSRSEFR